MQIGRAAERIRGTLLECIGDTPLVDLSGWAQRQGCPDEVRIWGKLEGFNPGGSVKDRPALSMILDGFERGAFDTSKTLLDSTSGNTGIAYALIGSALGFSVKLCIPENASRERLNTLRAFGAELVLTDPMEGSDGAIMVSQEMLETEPQRYWKPDQYNNPANSRAHELTTAPEIWRQTDQAVTHVFASLGTSGTAMGLKEGLGQLAPHVEVWGVEPDHAFHGLEGLKHMASSIVPGIYDESVLDGKIPADTELAYRTVHRLATETGLMIGPSGAAAMNAAVAKGKELGAGNLVVVFPDGGARYLSTHVWQSILNGSASEERS